MFCRVQHFISTMSSNDVIFTVHYGDRFNRKYKCTYVGRKIGVFDDTYDLVCLSFIEIKTIVKKFGYQTGDLIYYLHPNKSLDDELVLLTCDDDILRMSEFLVGQKVVVLYTMAFRHGDEEDDEPSDDHKRRNKVINDPYWKSLINSNDDEWDDRAEPVVYTSIRGDVYGKDECAKDDGKDGMEEDDDDFQYGDGDYGEHSKIDPPITINVGGSTYTARSCGQLLDGEEEDDVSFKLSRSDVLISPPASDDENEVGSRTKCVPKDLEFHEANMDDPKLTVGRTFRWEAIQTSNQDIQFD